MSINRARLIPGLILIFLGILFLLLQYFEFGPDLFLVLLGLVFLIPYVVTRIYGILIPGCILTGIGVGLMFDRPPLMPGVAVLIGLGLAFIAIYVVQLVVARAAHWWSLIPGGILVVVGIGAGIPQMQTLIEKGWSLILVLIGLGILARIYLPLRGKDF